MVDWSSAHHSTPLPLLRWAVLIASSGSPALPQGFSLWLCLRLSLSLSLSHWIKNEMKLINWTFERVSHSLFSLYYLISVSLSLFWTVSIWLANLVDFHFFFSSVFVFLNLVVHTLCSLASYTPALITIFFFFFGSYCTTTTMCSTVSKYLTPLICVFVFGGCLCVGLGLLYPIWFGLL